MDSWSDRFYFLILILLFFNGQSLFGGCLLNAVLPPAFFKNYDIDDYQASCQNWDIAISPEGVLYVANNSGLLSFDGNNWFIHPLPDRAPVKQILLSQDTIYTKGETCLGYWLEDITGTLFYTPLDTLLSSIYFPPSDPEPPFPLPEEILQYIPTAYATIQGVNFTGTLTNGLFVTDDSGERLIHITDRFLLQDNIVHALKTYDPAYIWIAFDNGLSSLNLQPALRMFGKRNFLGKLQAATLRGDSLYIETNTGFYKRSIHAGDYFSRIDPDDLSSASYFSEPASTSHKVSDLLFPIEKLTEFTLAENVYPVSDTLFWLTESNQLGLFSHSGRLKCRLSLDNYKLNLVTHGTQLVSLNDSLHVLSTIQGIVLLNTNILIRNGIREGKSHSFVRMEYFANDSLYAIPFETGRIVLPYNFQKLNLYVGSTIFTPNNQLSYQLQGVSGEWSPWQKEGKISFLQLPEGKYTLKVRKYVPTGEFPEITLLIEVRTPWYNTVWAWLLYILICAVVVKGVVNYHLNTVRKEEQLLLETERQLKEKKVQEIKNKLLESELQNKTNELMLQTSNLVRKSRTVHELIEELEDQKKTLGNKYPDRLYKKLRSMMEKTLEDQNDWLAFEHYFNSAHQDFIEKLRQNYTDLTTGDIRVCCLLRMNLSTKEIASILNVSIRAIELRRYRLRKRMGLDSDTNLVDFLMGFDK